MYKICKQQSYIQLFTLKCRQFLVFWTVTIYKTIKLFVPLQKSVPVYHKTERHITGLTLPRCVPPPVLHLVVALALLISQCKMDAFVVTMSRECSITVLYQRPVFLWVELYWMAGEHSPLITIFACPDMVLTTSKMIQLIDSMRPFCLHIVCIMWTAQILLTLQSR